MRSGLCGWPSEAGTRLSERSLAVQLNALASAAAVHLGAAPSLGWMRDPRPSRDLAWSGGA